MVKRDLSDHLKSYESYFLDIYFFFFLTLVFLTFHTPISFFYSLFHSFNFLIKFKYEKIKYPRVTISSCSNLIFEI